MLILDGLGATPFILAILYLATTFLIASRLRNLHARHRDMNTTKLFVLSVLLSCTMRCLSFIALGAFSVQSIAIDNNSSGGSSPLQSSSSFDSQDPDTQFYEKVRGSLRNLSLSLSSHATRLHDLPPLPLRVISAFVLPSLFSSFISLSSRPGPPHPLQPPRLCLRVCVRPPRPCLGRDLYPITIALAVCQAISPHVAAVLPHLQRVPVPRSTRAVHSPLPPQGEPRIPQQDHFLDLVCH